MIYLQELITAVQNFFTFDRMLICFFSGLTSVYLDGGLMRNRGLYREASWARGIGFFLALAAVVVWGALQVYAMFWQ